MSDYALVVGINDYPYYKRPLKGAISDADEFAKWLVDPDGGNVAQAQCEVIRSTAEPLVPLRTDIDKALVKIRNAVVESPTGRGRRFYFYFSGHGLGVSHTETALCTAQWDDSTWTHAALNLREYYDMFLSSGLFDEIVVLADCCRTRLLSTGGQRPDFQWTLRPGVAAAKARMFIGFATQYTNKAFEAAVGGNPDDVRGFFTRALLAALRGGAAQPTGGVPASRLKNYLEDHTPKLSKDGDKSQFAEVLNGFTGNDEPIFGNAKPASMLRVAFSEGRGRVRLVDGELKTVFEADPTDTDWSSVPIDAGRLYILKDLVTNAVTPIQVETAGVVDVTF